MLNHKEFVLAMQQRIESIWLNGAAQDAASALAALTLTRAEVDDAEARLERFAPLSKRYFQRLRRTAASSNRR